MQAINLALFHALHAQHALTDALLWLAQHGASLGAALVAWVLLRFPRERVHGCAIVLAALLASAMAHALAESLAFARPYMAGMGPPRIPHSPRGALPSAHATVMFTVALLLWRRPGLRWTALAATMLALLTGWGRIHAGVHFPFDIAAGLLLALVIATAVHVVMQRASGRRAILHRRPAAALGDGTAAP